MVDGWFIGKGGTQMQRWSAVLAGAALLVLVGATALAGEEMFQGYRVVNVIVNGSPLHSDVPAVNFNGRTVLPLRAVAELAGMDVQWDPASSTATLTAQVTPAKFVELQGDNNRLTAELASAKKDAESARAELITAKRDLGAAQAEAKRLTAMLPAVVKPAPAPAAPEPPVASPALTALALEIKALGYDLRYVEQDEGQHYRLTSLYNYVEVGIKTEEIPASGNYNIGIARPVLERVIPLIQKHFPKSEIWMVYLFREEGGRGSRCERSIPSLNIGGCSGENSMTGAKIRGQAQNRWLAEP